jgi:hypothetical protein
VAGSKAWVCRLLLLKIEHLQIPRREWQALGNRRIGRQICSHILLNSKPGKVVVRHVLHALEAVNSSIFHLHLAWWSRDYRVECCYLLCSPWHDVCSIWVFQQDHVRQHRSDWRLSIWCRHNQWVQCHSTLACCMITSTHGYWFMGLAFFSPNGILKLMEMDHVSLVRKNSQ